ncbi:TTAGGG repeat binding factor [Kluyveromyces marxianus]|nr:TTAGGG repeat binding factor [Kluyveromyces marxianus]
MTDVVKHDIHVFDSILPKLPESLQLLLKVLPVLDGVTVQLLQYFCANPFNTTLAIVSEDISNLYYVETQMFNSLLTVFKRLLCYYNKDPTTLKVSHILPGVWHDHHTPPSFIQSHER